jgi:hypothetical protein
MKENEQSNDVRTVESLHDAFKGDLGELAKDLPRVAAALERGETTSFELTPVEERALSAKTLWLLVSWVRSLAGEVDRLHTELDAEIAARKDFDS